MKNTSLLNNKHLLVFLVLVQLISCSSSDAGSGSNSKENMPVNLTVIPEIVGQSALNPNGDGSGTVKLNINATNATSYVISFGDGNNQNATSGITTYTYKTIGTYSYQVNVTAYNGTNSISVPISLKVYVSQVPIWADEFNIDGAPDSTKWAYDLGTGVGGWGNNESQYYTNRADNVKVLDGKLIITSKKESYQGKDYTSARIKTQGKFSFKYGRVDIKAKLPIGGGTWPALWMLGNNITSVSWPACGEIDIMEHIGNSQNLIHGTLHYPNNFGGTGPTKSTTISNVSTEFHIYSLDWRSDSIKFYVDGNLFHNFTNSTSLPFNQNFFLIVNSAMGGNFGGTIDPNFVSSTFEVDYIRVFN